VYFHEDDYCQIEILPLSAKKFCLQQISEIFGFAEKHTEEYGFSDIYIRNESPHSIQEVGISHEKISEILDFLPEFDKVVSEYTENSQLVFSRGINNHTAVFWEKDEDNIISAMWLGGMYIVPENCHIWRKILTVLGNTAPLMLADWNAGICIDLTNAEEIENYIRSY
ncbi:MAG: hypothetical protein K2K02_05060, partial [Ruminococcus sp.]|nr:hypothetical protein [Ruminococcus sp.]